MQLKVHYFGVRCLKLVLLSFVWSSSNTLYVLISMPIINPFESKLLTNSPSKSSSQDSRRQRPIRGEHTEHMGGNLKRMEYIKIKDTHS